MEGNGGDPLKQMMRISTAYRNVSAFEVTMFTHLEFWVAAEAVTADLSNLAMVAGLYGDMLLPPPRARIQVHAEGGISTVFHRVLVPLSLLAPPGANMTELIFFRATGTGNMPRFFLDDIRLLRINDTQTQQPTESETAMLSEKGEEGFQIGFVTILIGSILLAVLLLGVAAVAVFCIVRGSRKEKRTAAELQPLGIPYSPSATHESWTLIEGVKIVKKLGGGHFGKSTEVALLTNRHRLQRGVARN